MIGSWRYDVGFGAFGALLVFLVSQSHNPLGTTFQRSFYALLVFAALSVIGRVLLGILLHPGAAHGDPNAEERRGRALDLMTPAEDDELSEMMKEQWTGGQQPSMEQPANDFQPLRPKRLVSLDNPNPEEVVQAIRRLTDE